MSSDADADVPPSAADADAASAEADPVLAVDGLRKRYDDTVALDGVD
ncbi:ABC transporter ATP-binding protein, partial [Halorubrum sp. Atlit-26R]